MIADGGDRTHFHDRAVEHIWRSRQAHRTRGRQNFCAAQLRMFCEFPHSVETTEGDVGAAKGLRHASRVETRKSLCHLAIERRAVFGALAVGRKQRMVNHVGSREHVSAEICPLPLGLDRDDELSAIAARIGAVRRDRRMVEPEPLWLAPRILAVDQRNRHPVGDASNSETVIRQPSPVRSRA